MAFKTAPRETSAPRENTVDWDKYDQYVVETAGLQEVETLPGYIAAIVDLGIQKQEDAAEVFEGSAEDEAKIIAKYPDTYFENGKDKNGNPARLKRYPRKAQQAVVLAVEFPDIIIDKGQFFGESNPQPLRMWLGGKFNIDKKNYVSHPAVLNIVNLNRQDRSLPKVLSLAANSLLYKMAVADKLIKPGQAFMPENIDQLLGKTMQFQVQIKREPSKKDASKVYLKESIKFASGLARGQVAYEPKHSFIIEFDGDNPAEYVKQLPEHVRNTIKLASNYHSSKIKQQLGDDSPAPQEEKKESNAPVLVITPAVTEPIIGNADAGDDDSPF